MTKFKIYAVLSVFIIALIAYGLLNMEFVQKKVFDIKADMVGSHRSISFYNPISAERVASYTDKDMRYETKALGVISVWLGSQNKKVESSMLYIIEDVK